MFAVKSSAMGRKHNLIAVAALAGSILCIGSAHAAENFPEKLDRILKEHNLMRMVDADVATANAQIGVEKTAYFPKLTVGAGIGRQHIDRDIGTKGNFDPSDVNVGLNQLITDFGHTGLRVQAAETILDKEGKERDLQRQNLVLAAIEAQLQIIRADRTLRYAQQSELNIKRQTSLENARMEAGRGYATDVLQAKAQLAGAEARRVIAESRMSEARNRYRAVFGETPVDLAGLQAVGVPAAQLPRSEAEIADIIVKQNPDVVAADGRTEVTLAERHVQRARELMPRLALQLNQIHYQDYDGIKGDRNDTKAMVRFDWTLDLGMKAARVTEAADLSVLSAKEKAGYVRVQALEEGRNAWVGWQTARERTNYLINQAQISGNFLELARKERELGRRSLLDLLNGEVALINAQSDAAAARVDEVIASYRLLRAIGGLNPDVVRNPGMVIPADKLLPFSTDGAFNTSANK
ncbi:TolC family protein [Zoogloea sp.]|uniref:TolC family protein n=1 Tax=Zoogloea sp. TaxID=49181 RepID=UPI0025D45B6B|nr:TolC family protein [Zoogloea sp.]MCK6396492.1 TolC family protein [Zoogloea sp.]